jgi:hypothetical protein
MSLPQMLMVLGFILSVVGIVLYMFLPNIFSQTAMYSVCGTGAGFLLLSFLLNRMK